MIVIGDGSPTDRRQPVTHFLADDAPELTHRGSHRRERRLKTLQRLLGFKLGNEIRRVDQVRAKDRYELSFAVGIPTLLRSRATIGAPTVARVHCRSARETKHYITVLSSAEIRQTKHPAGSPAQEFYRLWRTGTDGTSRPAGCLWTLRSLR